MANTLTGYNPIFLANEALIRLEAVLGMAARVYRGYDDERKAFGLGEYIRVRRPSALTVQAGGTGTIQELTSEYIDIRLSGYYEAKFAVTDKEMAYGGQRIIDEHISPAVYAIAAQVDADINALRKNVPWSYNEGTFGSAGLLAARQILRDNAGAVIDQPGMVHMACDSTVETNLLGLDIFQDASVQGVQNNASLLTGALGTRWNINFFTNTNLGSHTGGTVTTGTDQAGALTADVAKGATSIVVGSFAAGETFKAGDSIVIAGNTQRYAVTADVTLTGGAGTVSITPPAVQAYTSGDVVTAEDDSTTVHAGSYYPNILFHRNAFAVAFAPLPELTGIDTGVKVTTITDPRTGISIRARTAYDDTYARSVVTIDVLYGVACLDPNLAVIYRRNK